jgi:hypothetical protein
VFSAKPQGGDDRPRGHSFSNGSLRRRWKRKIAELANLYLFLRQASFKLAIGLFGYELLYKLNQYAVQAQMFCGGQLAGATPTRFA